VTEPEALAELPPREQEVWTLFIEEGLSPEQIAAQLAITRNNVDQILHRGRKKLQELLARG
jgi:RNA polymerase sigma factor (sigma-70 family)